MNVISKAQKELNNWPIRTFLALLVSSPYRYFVGLDSKSTKLLSFTDNKGTNLMKPLSAHATGLGSWFDDGLGISADHHSLLFNTVAIRVPAHGATAILFRAKLVLLCGTHSKSVQKENISLLTPTQLVDGPINLKIGAGSILGPKKIGHVLCEFVTGSKLLKSTDVSFMDGEGKKLKAERVGWSKGDEYFIEYDLHEALDRVSISFDYFDKTTAVPFIANIYAPVGF